MDREPGKLDKAAVTVLLTAWLWLSLAVTMCYLDLLPFAAAAFAMLIVGLVRGATALAEREG